MSVKGAEVTIREEDGKRYAVLQFEDAEFKEAIADHFFTLPPDKQKYWARRWLVKLDRQAKKHRALKLHKKDATERAIKAVDVSNAIMRMNDAQSPEDQAENEMLDRECFND